MRRALAGVLACLWICAAGARNGSGEGAQPGSGAPLPLATPLQMTDALVDKNFYFLRILEEPGVRRSLRDSSVLSRVDAAYRTRLAQTTKRCGVDAACYIDAARLGNSETTDIAAALRSTCVKRKPVCAAIVRPLRESGTMVRFHDREDSDFLVEAWTLTALGVDHIFKTYGKGTTPRYPAIDSMSHDPSSAQFGEMVRNAARTVVADDGGENTFFHAWLQFARRLLVIDGRDEAGRHEPLEQGENRQPFECAKTVDWSRYPYSAILVPGQGPDKPHVRLAPEARPRLELAAARYRKGIAPFILVSGGYVHPARTPFNEAIEMKRALIEDYEIPPCAVMVEPHARHTTTNLRNTVRLLYRYGAPLTTPIFVVSSERQIAYIMTTEFEERNQQETGIVPWLDRRLISPVEVEFTPNIAALQSGFQDPLDP